jgi:hypothetical protein
MDEKSLEGLLAFSEHWISLHNQSFETGDDSELRSITLPGCETCTNLQNSLAEGHASGKWMGGGKIHIKESVSSFTPTTLTTGEKDVHQVVMSLTQDATTFYAADGTVIREISGYSDPETYMLLTQHQNGKWMVVDFGTPD